ncbi:MAG TPA: hypothetical protein VGW76_01040 [Pyrinomonadaceae bacterium]|nr:hypothetical protein [Pyrinomonadaceae bacterium]
MGWVIRVNKLTVMRRFRLTLDETQSGVVGEWVGKCENTKRSEASTGYSQAGWSVNKNDTFASAKVFTADLTNNRLRADTIRASIDNDFGRKNISAVLTLFA